MMTYDGGIRTDAKVRSIGLSTAMRPYPDYRHSGVNRLGRVPEHWEVRRLKHSLGVNVAVLPEDTEPDYEFRYIDIGSVETGELTSDPIPLRFETAPSRARRVVRPGDTLLSTVRTYLKAVWHAEDDVRDLVASTGFAVLTPRPLLLPKFVGYACRSEPFTNHVTAESVGVVYPAIAEARLASALRLCIPPLPEQRAIVRFLDHADRRIRRYIRAKERLIELLEEQKQAIIHQAVTGQIDVQTGRPYPAYKDSGVEWLGEVPEHWGVRKLRSHFRRHGSGTTPSEKEHFGGSVSWVMSGDLNDGEVDSTSRTVTRRAIGELPALKMYPPESLVVAMYGATIGRTGILSINACTNQACFVLADPFPDTDTVFFQAVLVSARRELVSRSFGGGQPNINAEVVRSFRVPSPTFSEQEAIASFVKRTAVCIDAVAMLSKREIDLVHEYRIRLIADVVTGQLDAREVAANFPDIDPLAAKDAPKGATEFDAEPQPTRP